MRLFKFRAWHENQMYYDGSFCFNQVPLRSIMPEDEVNVFPFEGIESGELITGDALEKQQLIMQFTGIKDANGNEIFEGDIIELRFADKQVEVFKVVWRDQVARFELIDQNWENWSLTAQNHMVIVGNIYQNPELFTHTVV